MLIPRWRLPVSRVRSRDIQRSATSLRIWMTLAGDEDVIECERDGGWACCRTRTRRSTRVQKRPNRQVIRVDRGKNWIEARASSRFYRRSYEKRQRVSRENAKAGERDPLEVNREPYGPIEEVRRELCSGWEEAVESRSRSPKTVSGDMSAREEDGWAVI
jgi:hypothetical protein